MVKRKLAVFVEGQTELIFVREFLKNWYGYNANAVGFTCYHLRNNEFRDAEYKYGDLSSDNYFMIVNVGNDSSVLSNILHRLKLLKNQGFQLVMGLRDMYSKDYIHDAQEHVIKEEINQKYIESVRQILQNQPDTEIVDFHFAIMETEAWLLGMCEFLELIDSRLTIENIQNQTGLDLKSDPKKTIFHPAHELSKLYASVGKQYDKHQSNISTIMSHLTKENYLQLIKSGKCLSFKKFAQSLLGVQF